MTYDPRGVERSTKADPASPSTPEQHADDLHRLIAELDAGPVDLFASSGGAVNALALVAKHPEQVRTLVAHEPPLASILPDRESALACHRGRPRHLRAQRLRCRHGAVHRRRQPPGPDSARITPVSRRRIRRCSGCRPKTMAAATIPLLGQYIVPCTHFEPDFEALRAASTRIVMAAGVESGGHDGATAAHSPSPSASARPP